MSSILHRGLRGLVPAGLLAVALVWTGCSGGDSGLPADRRLKSKTGDEAWNELLKLTTPPPPPASWATNAPSTEEFNRFRDQKAELAALGADLAKDFYTRFPKHVSALAARLREFDLVNFAVQFGHTNSNPRLETLEAYWVDNPAAPEDLRFGIRMQQLQRRLSGLTAESPDSALSQFETSLRELRKKFPTRPEVAELYLSLGESWVRREMTLRGRALYEDVLGSGAPAELKAAAQGALRKIERVGKPLAIRFTSSDGRVVDLAAMKGKVVLVDFWTTYCVTCTRLLPGLKELYAKFQPKGFEIVGISLDESDAEFKAYLKQHQVPWPQYRDGQVPDLKFGDQFQIELTPTLWLVDKQGNLRFLGGEQDLPGKLQKLLAE